MRDEGVPKGNSKEQGKHNQQQGMTARGPTTRGLQHHMIVTHSVISCNEMNGKGLDRIEKPRTKSWVAMDIISQTAAVMEYHSLHSWSTMVT